MLNWTLFVIFGVLVFNYADGQYPGTRLILTSKALDYVSSLIIPSLEKELSQLKIADVSNETNIMLNIGTINYVFSNIHLSPPFIKSSTIGSSTNGITLQLSNIALISKCNWEYEMEYWPYISDHGRVEIKIRNAAIKMTFLVTKSADGHPVIHTTKCNVILPRLSVDIHGSKSWLNWIYGLFQSKIEEILKSKLCEYVNDTTKEWNAVMSSYPLSKEINDFIITYGLLRDPVFGSDQIQFDLEGEVLTTMSDDSLSQSVVHVLPAIESTDNMIHLLLTDKLFATGVMDAINCGLLNYTITPDKIPSDFPLKLNTEFFKHTVPKLFKQFPNLPVTVAIEINKYKEVYLDQAGVHVSLLGNLLLRVIRQDGIILDAFSIELEVRCTLEVDILQPNDKVAVVLEATDLQATLGKLTSSSFGEFETAALKRALNGISLPLMFIINEYMRKGFAIPNMDKVNFIHPLITLKKDYMQVSADFEYLLNKK